MKIALIAGARPNFVKIAPIIHELDRVRHIYDSLEYRLIHTGQHFDKKMSDDFFSQLNIPNPHVNLKAGGGSQAEQTAAIMIGFENELKANPVDLVVVVGDVTSTLACSLVAKKMNIKVAHVEAGIRSGDMTMPEEINRIVTDSISDYFFTTTLSASNNLIKCGVSSNNIFFVGNTMIDSLLANINKFQTPEIWDKALLRKNEYLILTLHRPVNVDDLDTLKKYLETLIQHSRNYPIIFPIHPRTKLIFDKTGIQSSSLFVIEPLSYLEFNFLVKNCKCVITDSGGITEETTVLGIPCITLRNSTERPETVEIGTNELIGTGTEAIPPALDKLFSNNWKIGAVPELWDGQTSKRIVKILCELNA